MKNHCLKIICLLQLFLFSIFLFIFTGCPPSSDSHVPEGGDSYEEDNSYDKASSIEIGIPQEHTLHYAEDKDYMKFEANSDGYYVMQTFSPEDNTDTILVLYDTDGTTQIAWDDNSTYRNSSDDYRDITRTLQSRIEYKFYEGGIYYLMVQGSNGDTGAYTVLVRDTTPQPVEWCGSIWLDDGVGLWSIQDTDYVMTGAGRIYYSYTLAIETYADFTMEVDIMKQAGPVDDYFAIWFRCRTNQYDTGYDAYHFNINPDGTYSLRRYFNGGGISLLFDQYSDAIIQGIGSWNKFGVTMIGSTIILYANSVPLATIDDSSIASGSIGLCAYDAYEMPYSVVHFRNFVISEVF